MFNIETNNKTKQTKAFVNGCENDALVHIEKRTATTYLAVHSEEATMCDTYSGTVVCHADDVYDEKVGESEAVKKAMRNHNTAFKKALIRWQAAVLKDVIAASPETFEQALHKVYKCKCKGK